MPVSSLPSPSRFHQTRQVKALAALEKLSLGLSLLAQTPQANKSAGGIVVKLVAGFVRRQLFAVETVVTLAANDRRLALEELDADRPGHIVLIARHVMEQVNLKSAEPQSIIDYICVLLGHDGVKTLGLLAQHQCLQLAVGVVQNYGPRCLVEFARLDADEPILDMV